MSCILIDASYNPGGGSVLVVSGDANNDITIGGDGGAFLDLSASGLSFGAENEIPTVNAAGDGYDYDANFTWDGTNLLILGQTTGIHLNNNGFLQTVSNIRYSAASGSAWTAGRGSAGDFFITDVASGFDGVIIRDIRTADGPIFQSDGSVSIGDGGLKVGPGSQAAWVHLTENNTSTVPTLGIEQLSTGDAALQFSIAGDSYAIGIDNDDGDKLKISYAAAAGTAVLGTNDIVTIDQPNSIFSTANIYPLADDTYYLGRNDDDSPLAWKGVVLVDQVTGTYYRIEMVNGTITATDLTD